MSKQPVNSELANPNSNPVVKTSGVVVTSEDKGRTPKKKKRKCKCKGFSSENSVAGKDRNQTKSFDGKPWFREQKIWRDYIKIHRKDIRNAKPLVDDSPPRLNVSMMYDVEMMKQLRDNLKGAFDLNALVVKSLHEVNIMPGKTATFSFNYKKPLSSNYQERKADTLAIERYNKLMSKAIKNPTSSMPTAKEYAEEWKRMEMIIENSSQFPLFWKVKKPVNAIEELSPPPPYFRQYITEKSSKYSDKRPRIFFEVSIVGVGVVGKMTAMLYSDYVPMTVKNFLSFCDPKGTLTYKGNLFYLIFQNFYCQTGDVVENKGYGGTSIYGPYFGSEDFTLKHRERGTLTMYQRLPNRNESQFLITFQKLESLDGVNVVFGKIIKGLHVLDAIESLGSKKTGRPKAEIYISDCDEI